MEKILVTGATGNIGSKLIRKLLENNHVKVCAAVHSPIKAQLLNYPNLELCKIDYNDPASIDRAFEDADKLFLLTPIMENEVDVCKMMVDKAKAAGVKHIVRISAEGSKAQPGIQIMQWHREVDDYLKSSGMTYTILRPNIFMENYINLFAPSIRAEGRLYLPEGDGKLAMICAEDIADCAAKILTEKGHENKVYVLTGKEAISNHDVAKTLSEVLGKHVEYVDVPPETARQNMLEVGTPEWMVNVAMELHHIIRHSYLAETTNAVRDIIGRDPLSFKEFAIQNKEEFEV